MPLKKPREGGPASWWLTDSLSTVQNADLIEVLQNGKIKEQGMHQELLRNRDTYFGLAAAQCMH